METSGWEEKVTVPGKLVYIFTKQLAILLSNGVSIIQALDVLSHQEESPNFGVVIAAIAAKIEQGHRLSTSMGVFPRVFSPMFCAMVSAGESTGQLAPALHRLSSWLESDHHIRERVKGALSYPAFILGVAMLLTLSVFYFVMPEFIGIFVQMGVELPLVTKFTFFCTELVRNPGAWCLGLVAGVIGWRLLAAKWARPDGAEQIFGFILALPVIGKLIKFATLARFASAAELCLSTGLEIAKTLQLAVHASGSPVLRKEGPRLKEALIEGRVLSDVMHSSPNFHSTLTFLVQTGEEVARLEEMFGQASRFYDRELQYSVAALSALIEPILLFGVALIVGVILFSIFLPMYSFVGKLALGGAIFLC